MHSNPVGAWMTVLVTALFALIPIAFITAYYRKNKTRRRLFAALGGVPETDGCALTDAGRAFHVRLSLRNKNTFLEVFTHALSPLDLEITPRAAADSLVEAAGLESRRQTGDPDFDGRFHVACADAAFFAAYFADPRRRQAAAALLDSGFKKITLSGGVLKVSRPAGSLLSDIDPEPVRAAPARMAALIDSVPPPPPAVFGAAAPSASAFDASKLFLGAIAGGGGFLLMNTREPVDNGPFFTIAFALGTPIAAVLIAAAVRGMRGASWKRGTLWQFAGAFFFICMGIYAALGIVNAAFDRGRGAEYKVAVRKRSANTSSRHPHYHVWVDSWRPPRQTEYLEVSRSVYDHAEPGATLLHILVRPGALGAPWISAMEVLPAPGTAAAQAQAAAAAKVKALADARSHELLANQRTQAKDLAGAAAELRLAEQEAPAEASFHMERAEVLAAAQDWAGAAPEWIKAERLLAPNDFSQIRCAQGAAKAAVALKDCGSAKAAYRRAIDYANRLARGAAVNDYLGLAYCQAETGERDAAVMNYRKAETMASNPGTRAAIEERLAALQTNP